jgi:hypothetical protein
MTKKARFVLKLRPQPQMTDSIKALRAALRAMLRKYGLRCIAGHEESRP